MHQLSSVYLVDVEPAKLKPTWRNKRTGIAGVSKRLDRFMVANQLLKRVDRMRSWVGTVGGSDHNPIYLDLIVTVFEGR